MFTDSGNALGGVSLEAFFCWLLRFIVLIPIDLLNHDEKLISLIRGLIGFSSYYQLQWWLVTARLSMVTSWYPPGNFPFEHSVDMSGKSIHVWLIWKVDSPMMLERAKEVRVSTTTANFSDILIYTTFMAFALPKWLPNPAAIHLYTSHFLYLTIQAWMKNVFKIITKTEI